MESSGDRVWQVEHGAGGQPAARETRPMGRAGRCECTCAHSQSRPEGRRALSGAGGLVCPGLQGAAGPSEGQTLRAIHPGRPPSEDIGSSQDKEVGFGIKKRRAALVNTPQPLPIRGCPFR